MLCRAFVFISLLATSVVAQIPGGFERCGTPEPTEDQRNEARAMAREETAHDLTRIPELVVDTVFHVLALNKTVAGGWLSQKTLRAQLAATNQHFEPSKISFKLVDTTRTINKTWANSKQELEMKRALRQGDYKTLNVYFRRHGGPLGETYLPLKNPTPLDIIRDGATVRSTTVPGGSLDAYDEGKTLTHEIGHWLNLFHTFDQSCDPGDLIADTPAEKKPHYGCHIGRDTCPGRPGLDPIHNYMDYSDDSCMDTFSPGQAVRMHNAFNKFRADA